MTDETGQNSNKIWWENGMQQCIAYMLDIPFPVIARRYQKEKSRAIKITLGWTIAIAILLAVSTIFAVRAMQKAEESEKTAQELANLASHGGQRSRYALKLQAEGDIILKDTVFIDFVTTVTAFKGVIDYKKKGGAKFYQNKTSNEMAIVYSQRFEKQVRDYIDGMDDLVFSAEKQLKFVRISE